MATNVKLEDSKGNVIFEGTGKEFSAAAKKMEKSLKGHNRVGGIAADQLKSIIERVEKLEEEKHDITDSISEIYLEARGNGFDVKTIKKIIKMRKKDAAVREEEETILDTYLHALGMLADTPLGEAAMERARK